MDSFIIFIANSAICVTTHSKETDGTKKLREIIENPWKEGREAGEMKGTNCPFCRCDPAHQRVEEYCAGEWYVVCEVCRATGPRCDTEERARWYWNQSHANAAGQTPAAHKETV